MVFPRTVAATHTRSSSTTIVVVPFRSVRVVVCRPPCVSEQRAPQFFRRRKISDLTKKTACRRRGAVVSSIIGTPPNPGTRDNVVNARAPEYARFFHFHRAPPEKRNCVWITENQNQEERDGTGGDPSSHRENEGTHTQSHRRICIHLYIHTADLGFGFSGRLDTLGFGHRRRIAIAIGGIECTCCVFVWMCASAIVCLV